MHLGPHILLEAGGRLLYPAEFLRRLRRQQGAVPKRTKSSAMVKVCAAVMAAQSARPGALNMPGSGALAAAAGPKGKGSEGATARSPAALPIWPPMVAMCSGAMALHLLAIRGAPGSPRAEI